MARRPWSPRTHQLCTHLGPQMAPSWNLGPPLLPRPWSSGNEPFQNRSSRHHGQKPNGSSNPCLTPKQRQHYRQDVRPSCPAQGLHVTVGYRFLHPAHGYTHTHTFFLDHKGQNKQLLNY